jgi:carbon-monoxide dehydrogenase large subunit/6-hydroxypseudooxynicotine dehydrogenase subunit gamma
MDALHHDHTQYDLGATKVFGKSVVRLEDPPLVTGQGRYIGDLAFPRQLHMRVVRSPYAHAKLTRIDTAAARAAPGVIAVWTAADIADMGPIDFRDAAAEALKPYRQPILAQDTVRYVGEPVAAVFAIDPYLAEDAADLIIIEADDLPVLLAAEAPTETFSPGKNTEALIMRCGYGDLDAAFASAHMIIDATLKIGRHSGTPMENRGAIGRYDAAFDVLQLWGAAKVPHRNRDALVRALGRSNASIELHEGHTGGGFGIRGELYPEDFLVLLAALRLKRPVKWIEDRREHLMAANQSREQFHTIRAAVDTNGNIIGLDDEFFLDQGAYVRTHGARVPDMTMGMVPGPYRVPAFRCVCHFRLTNKTPAATYRAPGRFEGTFVRERLMDIIAARMAIDPVELRRRNLITPAEMPFHRPLEAVGTDVVYDSGDYPKLLDTALARFGWTELQETLEKRRQNGECVGAAIACFVEKGGLGPRDGTRISVDPTGAVEVLTGGASVGQGFETTMAQICAEALGVDYRRIRVTHGQTERIAYGIGAHASRATVMTGSATNATALKLREKALRVAGQLLQSPPASLDIIDGAIVRKTAPDAPVMTLGQLATSLAPDSPTLGDEEPGLSAEAWHVADHMTYPYGIHLAAVHVDRPTGKVTVEKFLIAYDVGRAVNPMLVEGQLVGGFAQGLGGALFEEFLYDERGEPLSVTFADYLIPTAHEVPDVDVLLTEDAPSPLNPLGIKGAGEGGITAVGAVIASAVENAIGKPATVLQTPVTPQRIRAILRNTA